MHLVRYRFVPVIFYAISPDFRFPGVITDDAKGAYASEIVYDDTNLAQLDALPLTQFHRKIDLAIVNADAQGMRSVLLFFEIPLINVYEGYVRAYIIAPSTVWGLAVGPLVDLGVQNAISMQIPVLMDASVDRGQGGMIGAGKNLWGNVNIEDSRCSIKFWKDRAQIILSC